METVVDINAIAEELKQEIKTEINSYIEQGYRAPKLGILLFGEAQLTSQFAPSKKEICAEYGIDVESYAYPDEMTQEELDATFDLLVPQYDAFIMQLPFPSGLTLNGFEKYADKDVECFTCTNLEKLTKGERCYIPSVPYGVITLLKHSGYIASDKNILILANNVTRIRPLADILSHNPYQAKIDIANINDDIANIKTFVSNADTIILFNEEPYYFKYLAKKDNCVVLNFSNEIAGQNMSYASLHDNHLHISPVPGGIGPMSNVAFAKNILKAYKEFYIPEEDARRTAAAEELARVLAENEAYNKAVAEQAARELAEAAARDEAENEAEE